MAKSCCMCGKVLGFFSDKVTFKDGHLCRKCLKAGGISSLSSSENYYTAQVIEVIKSRTEAVHNFRTTKRFGRL